MKPLRHVKVIAINRDEFEGVKPLLFKYRGKRGRVIGMQDGVGGSPEDPAFVVLFKDGSKDFFWREELARRRR